MLDIWNKKIICAVCESKIEIDFSQPDIIVDPCNHCLINERSEGHAEGVEDGEASE